MILKKNNSHSDISQIAALLKRGGICILPTDTVYGFSGIVPDAGASIRAIKGRIETKPFIRLIPFPDDICKYTQVHIPQELLSCWPGPLTIIVPLENIKDGGADAGTAAFRCPGDGWLRSLIAECGAPLYSTSVNRSGCPPLDDIAEMDREFGREVACIVDDGPRTGGVPSTIAAVDADGSYRIVRQGALFLPEGKSS